VKLGKRAIFGILLFGLSLTTGCTPDWYQRSADLQVKEILRDRGETTLGYRPQIQTPTTVSPDPTAKAYLDLPTSPIPPKIVPPLEPTRIEIRAAPLGPDLQVYVHAATQPAIANGYDIDVEARREAENLKLGPPKPASMRTNLDLFGSLQYAVLHGREYQNQMEEVFLTTLDVTLQRHLFDPIPFASTGVEYTGGQRAVMYKQALAITNTVGVRQQLPYGGTIVAKGLVDFVDTISGNVANGESASAALTASVPLLRGFGMVNLEPLISSERQVVYQVRRFEDFRRQFLVQVSGQYFRLLTLRQRLFNRRFQYGSYITLTDRAQAMYENQRLYYLDVQQALAQQLDAQSQLIDAEQAYQSAVDQFKLVLGMPLTEDLDIVPVELDVHPPNARIEDVAEIATKYRLDLQTARDQVDDARRGVSNAKNALLPDLNFNASAGAINPSNAPASHINAQQSNYSAGVTLDFPLDRVSERNAYRRSLIELEQAQRRYETLEETVSIAARDSLRSILSAQTNLKIQQLAVDLNTQRLDFANTQLRLGRALVLDVVNAQKDLLTAQDSYASAKETWQNNILQYLQQTGTLRVDPDAGALGQAMNRAALQMNKPTVPR